MRPTRGRSVAGRRKALGQHFLVDEGVARRTIEAAGIEPDEHVLEIGPGRGILTRPLLEAGARVTAVEVDERLARNLAAMGLERLNVIRADFLEIDLAELPDEPTRVVANLPYSTGTAIVERLLGWPRRFPHLIVMLQKEVAERLAAPPGSRSYGSLSVLTALWAEATLLFGVPPECFRPPPKVDSAVVRLDVADRPRVDPTDPEVFRRVVRAAFAQRRKMLRNSLRAGFGESADRALERAGIDARRRAETLTLAEFAALTRAVATHA